jgi:peptidyl-tRNA hydrolase
VTPSNDHDPDRLYIAVRADLSPGLQTAQAVHAALHFLHDHPSVVRPWLLTSNFLVVVSVPDEAALLDLITDASRCGLLRTAVREPDLDNAATAVAIEPGERARRLCGALPLALRLENAMT